MFRTNKPVAGSAFHDRRRDVARFETLLEELRAGEARWLAVIGPRKIGKTSLILEVSRRARDIDVVLVDTQDVTPLSLEIFRTAALRAVDAVLGAELPESLEVTVAAGGDPDPVLDASPAFSALPATVKTAIRSLGRAAMTSEFARVCLDLPERLAEALDRHVLFAMDEFQELSTLAGQKEGDPLPLIRSVWQRHRRTAYVVSGSGRSMLEEMVSHQHSPFFQHFSLLYIEPFGEREAIELLTEESPPERRISVELARRAVQVLGGHPFYLQLFGETLTSLAPPYDEASLKEALQEVLFSRSGRLSLYFELTHDRAVGRSTFLAAVLDALAEGPKRLVDVAAAIEARSADASRYIERLNDHVRKRPDGRYELSDPVFALWVRWRRPGGTVVPMTVVGDAAEREVAEHLARAGFDLVYQSRASRGSFDLLATRGADQVGIQVKRSALPLRFDRTTFQRMQADAERFGWRWVAAAVTDAGGVRFLDPARAKRGREIRLTEEAAIEGLVEWLRSGDVVRAPAPSRGVKSKTSTKAGPRRR